MKITRFLPIVALLAIVAGAIYVKREVTVKTSTTSAAPVMIQSIEPSAPSPAPAP